MLALVWALLLIDTLDRDHSGLLDLAVKLSHEQGC